MISLVEKGVLLLLEKIEESESYLCTLNGDNSNAKLALERYSEYKRLVKAEQDYLQQLRSVDTEEDATRLVNIINSISLMIRDDASSLINSLNSKIPEYHEEDFN